MQQLEEQLRQLNGRIEEMSFQLLQMQETIRKQQEDNEFRFQQLEKTGAGGAAKAPVKKSETDAAPAASGGDDIAKVIQHRREPKRLPPPACRRIAVSANHRRSSARSISIRTAIRSAEASTKMPPSVPVRFRCQQQNAAADRLAR